MRKLNIYFLVILGIWGAVNTWLRGTSALALAQNGVVFSLRVIKLSYLGKRSESRVPLARVLLKISPKWRACSQATIQVVGVGWGGGGDLSVLSSWLFTAIYGLYRYAPL